MQTIIGIDPGNNGGLCSINRDGMRVERMPIIKIKPEKTKKGKIKKKGKTLIDEHLLRAYLVGMAGKDYTKCMAVIEDVHSMPGDGGCSGFNFGTGYGIVRGMLIGLGIPYVRVSAMVWMKATCGKKANKKDKPSKRYCLDKHPDMDLRGSEVCRTTHDGITDAICIAEWAMQGHKFLNKIN